jgi:hypothetical protein
MLKRFEKDLNFDEVPDKNCRLMLGHRLSSPSKSTSPDGLAEAVGLHMASAKKD